MRYILLRANIQNNEIHERIKYLYDVFDLYMYVTERTDEYTVLSSIPTSEYDIIFLVGHNVSIERYIRKNKENIVEKIVVIDSCFIGTISYIRRLSNKKVYVSKNLNGKDYMYGEYGFNFKATESEILLYRYRKADTESILHKIYVDYNMLGGANE
jgi:hypothetical protein